ncbi:MAG: ferrous iron transport protein B [Puniceicoccales bacterium]|jgi:ferrous iron transport protein B|nr:ferrous iron transport protein B [Puniceicoccales bacterium]
MDAASPQDAHSPRIALIGNPNTGKSTLFNALTGLRQRVGNYPGVTVSKKSGALILPGGVRAELIDLPGLYSLAAASLDERVVIDVLCGHLSGTPVPDAIVCVVDSTNLLRNLFLASQVAELGIPMMLVLNQVDVSRKFGVQIDTAKLSERLGGIPVVAASAWHGEGIPEVRAAIATLLEKKTRMPRIAWHACVQEALDILRSGLERAGAHPLPVPELQRVLFDTTTPVLDRIQCDAHAVERIVAAARECIRRGGFNPFAAEPVLHYERLKHVLDGVATTRTDGAHTFTQRLDRILLNRVLGTFIFFVSMTAVFASVFWLAAIPQGWIETGIGWLGNTAEKWLEGSPILQSLVTKGVIDGVGAFMSFLPQILILFFFVAVLEDSGYMARAAFLMDKLFSWCGLNGKCFVPMLSGYACAIPSVMATRTIEDPKSRLATIFIIPFMSCSARLPVYSLMIGAFLVPKIGTLNGGLVMVAMYLLGLIVAIPTAWVFTRFILKTRSQPFVLEMPRYQVPKPRDVLLRMAQSGWEFVRRAGTIIFAITIIVWALLYFPHADEVALSTKKTFVAERAKDAGKKVEEIEAILEKATREEFIAGQVKQTGKKAEEIEAALEKATREGFIEEKAKETGKAPEEIEEALEADGGDPKKNKLAAALKQHIALAAALEAHIEPAASLEKQTEAAFVEHSYLGRFGKLLQPVFDPAGFDWKITIGVLASFPAREVIVSTLGITYSLGGEADEESDDLKKAMAESVWTSGPRIGKPIFTIPVVFGIMAFFALCSQCGATLATITKEAGWRWAVASFFYMTSLAWVIAVLCYQVGNLF